MKKILIDLETKMVLLSGPRQVGKTYLSKHLFPQDSYDYLNWDITAHKKIIKNESWDTSKKLVIFDEIHKLKKWKNYLKGVYDQHLSQRILVTGSARLETFRKAGDALTGRYYHYRLYPYDYSELAQYLPSGKLKDIIPRLLKTGGFPESYHYPENVERIRSNRLDQILNTDLRDLSSLNSVNTIAYLVELLRERICGTINYSNIANDLSVSAPTVKNWITHLEKLYVVFSLMPYSKNFTRAIKKDKKNYFYDCSMGVNEGANVENLMAVTLLKFIHFRVDTVGEKWELYYFRDKEKHEVDFIVEKNKLPHWLIEVKTKREATTPSLYYLKNKLPNAMCFQVSLEEAETRVIKGVTHISISSFCKKYISYL